jgi:ubiquitin-protein ligase
MPILIVEHNGMVEGAGLSGRALIGRRASDHIVVDDPDGSRIHAWIDTAGGQFCVTDAGSRTGTFVIAQHVTATVPQRHGDRIRAGPAVLTFRADASRPAGVSQLDFGRQRPADGEAGVSLRCACGAPLWAPAAFAGRTAECRACGDTVEVPARMSHAVSGAHGVAGVAVADHATGRAPLATMASPAQPVAARRTAPAATCGACQSAIGDDEALATCPPCGLTFRADCWAGNYGCSAYGSSRVNALLPNRNAAISHGPRGVSRSTRAIRTSRLTIRTMARRRTPAAGRPSRSRENTCCWPAASRGGRRARSRSGRRHCRPRQLSRGIPDFGAAASRGRRRHRRGHPHLIRLVTWRLEHTLMIRFTCRGCGQTFSVPPEYAGRRANCKACGTPLVVPAAAAGGAQPPAGRGVPMRTRRLIADAAQMAEAFAGSPLIKVRPVLGDPPEAYHVEYAVRGLERGKGNRPIPREHHLVEIRLTGDYPRTAPQCKMLTPVFHPNIDPTTICVGDPWSAGGRLVDLTVRIGEMIAYQAYDIQSPLDAEAAMWADLNAGALPVDPRPLRPGDA